MDTLALFSAIIKPNTADVAVSRSTLFQTHGHAVREVQGGARREAREVPGPLRKTIVFEHGAENHRAFEHCEILADANPRSANKGNIGEAMTASGGIIRFHDDKT